MMFLIDIRPINEDSSKTMFLKKFCESKEIARIYEVHYSGAQKNEPLCK